ncbi:hypothetical protein [Caldifermentibacillus hisashii]|uniref:hypothetical protein n=1 Tax=Caldifermentibacillus hisashii TaxID=996558 RepID=UPI0034140C0D|nr:hypothetical protein [Caldibacillus thermoamylovorans]
MKLSFSLKNKEASLEADVEGLVEKGLEHKAKTPAKKTRYQIKQEEKRKNEELKQKQQILWMLIMLGLLAVLIVFGVIATVLGI